MSRLLAATFEARIGPPREHSNRQAPRPCWGNFCELRRWAGGNAPCSAGRSGL